MRQNQNRRVLAGFILLIVVSFTTIFVFFLDDLLHAMERRYSLIAIFPTAPRLRLGGEVWIGGQQVGQVSAIGFHRSPNDTIPQIAVTLAVPTRYQSLVRADSKVRFTSERLIGEPVVDITPGSPTQPMLQNGDTLFGVARGGAMQAMISLVDLRQSIDSLLQATRALEPYAARTGRQLARLNRSISLVQAEFAELRSTFSVIGTDGFLNDPTLGEAFDRLSRTASQLAPAFDSAAARYADPALRQSFKRLQLRAETISTHISELRRSFANGTLLRVAGGDNALQTALAGIQSQIDSLVAETMVNPLRFFVGDPQPGLGNPLKRTR